jgi:hypothetical protein
MCNCNRTSSFDSGIGISYYKCDKKPYKQVQYKGATDGKIINEWLCKTHYNALIKNINRITLKTKYNFEFKTL